MENSFETIVTKVYDDGVYEGNLVDGKCTGKGEFTWGKGLWNGDVYEGDWVDDKFIG